MTTTQIANLNLIRVGRNGCSQLRLGPGAVL
jgi:hypothetical protein